MDITFLKFLVISSIFKVVSSGKDNCKRDFTQNNIQIKDGCSKEMRLEHEIHSGQCTEHCENDPQCKAVGAETSYKTKSCCLLYDNPVVMVTGTGTGNQVLYYKPGTKLIQASPDEYTIYTEMMCNKSSFEPDLPFNNQIDDVAQCKTACSSESYCNGFTHYEEYKRCFFYYTKCQASDLLGHNRAATYVKN